jgi:hypothetical protein
MRRMPKQAGEEEVIAMTDEARDQGPSTSATSQPPRNAVPTVHAVPPDDGMVLPAHWSLIERLSARRRHGDRETLQRDYVNGTVGFERLSTLTGTHTKSLM